MYTKSIEKLLERNLTNEFNYYKIHNLKNITKNKELELLQSEVIKKKINKIMIKM